MIPKLSLENVTSCCGLCTHAFLMKMLTAQVRVSISPGNGRRCACSMEKDLIWRYIISCDTAQYTSIFGTRYTEIAWISQYTKSTRWICLYSNEYNVSLYHAHTIDTFRLYTCGRGKWAAPSCTCRPVHYCIVGDTYRSLTNTYSCWELLQILTCYKKLTGYITTLSYHTCYPTYHDIC